MYGMWPAPVRKTKASQLEQRHGANMCYVYALLNGVIEGGMR